jgi:hypothetical protein
MVRLLEQDLGIPILEAETSLHEKQLRHTVQQRAVGESAHELLELRLQLKRVCARADHCRRRIEQLRRDADLGVHLIRYSPQDIVYSGGKVSETAIREDPNLVLMLQKQIRAADAVLVIAEMFAQYRLWMDCELGLAQDLGRPIIAVVPFGQLECPREVKIRAAAVVGWERVALAKALLPFAKRRDHSLYGQ